MMNATQRPETAPRPGLVDIRPLKRFAFQLPASSPLRSIILSEKDSVTVDEFLVKMDTWLKLSHLEH